MANWANTSSNFTSSSEIKNFLFYQFLSFFSDFTDSFEFKNSFYQFSFFSVCLSHRTFYHIPFYFLDLITFKENIY
ncbi:hypothetical protein MSSAC_4332 [Methanosarcina siciliae C2J]|uniref:Uncharacterized protein n=3 Tax=Methanosarcina siciliae TaxID=38027 RepID=A0A0E3PIT2_9EURY|nr:hypothetical protein MSSIT_3903 [Methanosarcina siciliae T4/M]AKB34523.1 hypothetical protein MSSIH_3833 [Methanosarcina siciliae HI350]AKB38922.1 hypothetical protein MSSAC_4332 [Methanosarcina siciliae C2J]